MLLIASDSVAIWLERQWRTLVSALKLDSYLVILGNSALRKIIYYGFRVQWCIHLIVLCSMICSRTQVVLVVSYAILCRLSIEATRPVDLNVLIIIYRAYLRVFVFDAREPTVTIWLILDNDLIRGCVCIMVLSYTDRLLTIAIRLSIEDNSICLFVYTIVLAFSDRSLTIAIGLSLDNTSVCLRNCITDELISSIKLTAWGYWYR